LFIQLENNFQVLKRNLSGWRGERGDVLTHPPRPRLKAVLHRARATEGPHWGMGGVSTLGLFVATEPGTSLSNPKQ